VLRIVLWKIFTVTTADAINSTETHTGFNMLGVNLAHSFFIYP